MNPPQAAAASPSPTTQPAPASLPARILGLRSGVGLVVANMVGSGVFLSAGFMAQDLGPGLILLSWVVGAALALCGARSYGELAKIIGESGGEYRYLSDLLHPSLGYLAGWASLLIGFAASISVDALSAGAFFQTLVPGADPRLFGAGLIILLTVVHSVHLHWSKWTQNVLVAVKVLLVLAFVALGLSVGSATWPTWTAPLAPKHDGFSMVTFGAFLSSQYWVAFTFSGWNAAIYAAGEFRNPKRDVPRAMLIGASVVAVLYLAVNWVFVANLTPEQAGVVIDESQRITLGHLVVEQLVGPVGGVIMSGCAVLLFASALSAMTFVGPRVYAEMAKDGFLPKALRGKPGKPPTWSVVAQGVIALVLLYTHSLLELVSSASAILMIFSGLTAVAVLWVRWRRPELPRPSLTGMVAAAIYLVSVVVLLAYGLQASYTLLGTVVGVFAIAGVAYVISRVARRDSDEVNSG